MIDFLKEISLAYSRVEVAADEEKQKIVNGK